MSDSVSVPRELLAHAAFVRRLAHSLLRDAHEADDLEQETWRAVLAHPPGHDQNLRGWLAQVMQNFARRRLRSARRRSEHELASARNVALSPAEVTLAQEELLQGVVDAVRQLEEPYRSVILERYFEGLSPGAVAARSGEPLQTIRTRQKRALAQLRARLAQVPQLEKSAA